MVEKGFGGMPIPGNQRPDLSGDAPRAGEDESAKISVNQVGSGKRRCSSDQVFDQPGSACAECDSIEAKYRIEH